MHGNYWRAMFRYGLVCGVVVSFVVLLRYWLILPLDKPTDYVQEAALLVCLFVAVWVYKKNLEDKKITLKEAYIVALGCGVVAAIVYGMFLLLYSRYIDSAMSERYYVIQRALAQNKNMADAYLREYTSPPYLAFVGLLFMSMVTVIEALVVSVIMRSERAIVYTKEMKKQDKEAKKKEK